MTKTLNKSNAGFTLIELSIVLVIIGLIVGGVLVGQDLIKAAEVRASVGQLEKYEAAANTFRGKYNGLPGDLLNPANFGFNALPAAFNATQGNGILNRTTDNGTSFDGEAAAFYRHLSQANMISEPITATLFDTGDVDAIASYIPASKLGRGAMILTAGVSGLNYYVLAGPLVTDGVLDFAGGTELIVIDAFNIDNKMDDGNPTTGKVVAVTNLNTLDAGNAGAAAGHCVDTTGNDSYQTSTTALQADTRCSIRIRASF